MSSLNLLFIIIGTAFITLGFALTMTWDSLRRMKESNRHILHGWRRTEKIHKKLDAAMQDRHEFMVHDPHWRIWSMEHDAWWGPSFRGYTQEIKLAGKYSYAEAVKIVRGANEHSGEHPNEAMIRIEEYGRGD